MCSANYCLCEPRFHFHFIWGGGNTFCRLFISKGLFPSYLFSSSIFNKLTPASLWVLHIPKIQPTVSGKRFDRADKRIPSDTTQDFTSCSFSFPVMKGKHSLSVDLVSRRERPPCTEGPIPGDLDSVALCVQCPTCDRSCTRNWARFNFLHEVTFDVDLFQC